VVNIGIIGYGYWGPNLVRNFHAQEQCTVKYVCDPRSERLQTLNRTFPTIRTVSDAAVLFNDPDLQAVVIATPVFTHFELAKQALNNGKHALIEKPLTASVKEALELKAIADKNNCLLMVDHTFLYTGAVQKIKEVIKSGQLGDIHYFDSTRINLGLFQPDINVLWDLAPHDLSVLNYLTDEQAYSVNATGVSHTGNGIENIAYLTVNYKSGFIAHFNCSWTSPVKIRTMLIGGDKKMLLFNDLEPTEKIRIYDTGYQHKTDEEKMRVMVDYRAGDVYLPKVNMKEALAGMAGDFINSIINKTKPVSDFESGYKVIRILEAAQKSIKQNGKEITLD
jgi:predicted dehydrogenase